MDILLPPFLFCFLGLRALRKRGSSHYCSVGEEDPHHNLSACSPPGVSGKWGGQKLFLIENETILFEISKSWFIQEVDVFWRLDNNFDYAYSSSQ